MYLFGFPEGMTGGSKETSYTTTYNTSRNTNWTTTFGTSRPTTFGTSHTTNYNTQKATNYNTSVLTQFSTVYSTAWSTSQNTTKATTKPTTKNTTRGTSHYTNINTLGSTIGSTGTMGLQNYWWGLMNNGEKGWNTSPLESLSGGPDDMSSILFYSPSAQVWKTPDNHYWLIFWVPYISSYSVAYDGRRYSFNKSGTTHRYVKTSQPIYCGTSRPFGYKSSINPVIGDGTNGIKFRVWLSGRSWSTRKGYYPRLQTLNGSSSTFNTYYWDSPSYDNCFAPAYIESVTGTPSQWPAYFLDSGIGYGTVLNVAKDTTFTTNKLTSKSTSYSTTYGTAASTTGSTTVATNWNTSQNTSKITSNYTASGTYHNTMSPTSHTTSYNTTANTGFNTSNSTGVTTTFSTSHTTDHITYG